MVTIRGDRPGPPDVTTADGSGEDDPAGPADRADPPDDSHDGGRSTSYIRFVAMIVTAMVAMFALTYVNTYEWSHVEWSETRVYMTFVMGAAMAVIMLAFMVGMYRNTAANIAIVVAAVAVFAGALYLVRSQTTVQDESYMRAMIPHHSIAILTSERAEIDDVRVCELAVEIVEAQRREIAEMQWLISDISANGPAETDAAAAARAVPDFAGSTSRSCGGP